MDAPLIQQMSEFDDLFQESDSLRYLELLHFEDSTRNVYTEGSYASTGTAAKLWHEPGHEFDGEATAGLRIIFSQKTLTPPASLLDHKHLRSLPAVIPLQMTKDTFLTMARDFSFPSSYLRMLRDASTIFVDVQIGPDTSTGDTIQSFMLQNSFTTTWQFSVALSYDPKKCLTIALVHGLVESEMSALIEQVSKNKDCIALPMLLPSLLISYREASANTKVAECHSEIIGTEEETGLRTAWHPSKSCCASHNIYQKQLHGQNRYDALDFDRLTGNLTSLASKLAYSEYVCEVHIPMLDTFDEINKRFVKCSSERSSRLEQVEALLHTNNNFLRSSLYGTLFRAQYLSKRCQAQIQTVYSLIAQKDNALSMRDNAALKTISEDQKRIALAATKDSAAMGVIAAITVVFLPATFTATFFSTTFFDFQVGTHDRMVSDWVWIYFLVTVVLSALIISWWYLVSHRKIREIQNNFGGEEEKFGPE